MVIRHDRPPAPGIDHAEAKIEQAADGRAGASVTIAQPEHRSLYVTNALCQIIKVGRKGSYRWADGKTQVIERRGPFHGRPLHVDWNFNAHRTHRCRQGTTCGGHQDAECFLGAMYAQATFSGRPQHLGLTGHVVNSAGISSQKSRSGLTGDVQKWRAGKACFDNSRDRIGGSWARAGNKDA